MKNILIWILLFLSLTVKGQQSGDHIQWKERRQLAWADYQGKPDPGAGAAASTATYLSVEYNFKDGRLGYVITCSFSRSRSWGLTMNDYILSHEQGHFDIAEIFARQLYKKLKAYEFDKKNYQTDLRRIYEDITSEKEEMQNRYDRETNHSINKDKQAEWLEKIRRELKELEPFSGY